MDGLKKLLLVRKLCAGSTTVVILAAVAGSVVLSLTKHDDLRRIVPEVQTLNPSDVDQAYIDEVTDDFSHALTAAGRDDILPELQDVIDDESLTPYQKYLQANEIAPVYKVKYIDKQQVEKNITSIRNSAVNGILDYGIKDSKVERECINIVEQKLDQIAGDLLADDSTEPIYTVDDMFAYVINDISTAINVHLDSP